VRYGGGTAGAQEAEDVAALDTALVRSRPAVTAASTPTTAPARTS
jgi:hypothetical protein